jgi:hypothetical protein
MLLTNHEDTAKEQEQPNQSEAQQANDWTS